MIRRLVVVAAFAGAAAGCASAPHQPIVATDAQGNAVPIDSLTVSYEVGGLRVVQRPAPSNDVVAANLYLLGGARQLTPQTAGIEVLLLDASERGTARYPGDAARSRTPGARSSSSPAPTGP
ncbi:MAG: hypothetical protein IRY91_08005 [Gemmatimonadaceae bacterium]|nr:hypothetical protein [Gemmatimonadaceae bacterium]